MSRSLLPSRPPSSLALALAPSRAPLSLAPALSCLLARSLARPLSLSRALSNAPWFYRLALLIHTHSETACSVWRLRAALPALCMRTRAFDRGSVCVSIYCDVHVLWRICIVMYMYGCVLLCLALECSATYTALLCEGI